MLECFYLDLNHSLCVCVCVFQAELNEEELDSLKSQHCHLTQQLRDKDEMVKRLEEETAFLDKQHSDVQQEVCVFVHMFVCACMFVLCVCECSFICVCGCRLVFVYTFIA